MVKQVGGKICRRLLGGGSGEAALVAERLDALGRLIDGALADTERLGGAVPACHVDELRDREGSDVAGFALNATGLLVGMVDGAVRSLDGCDGCGYLFVRHSRKVAHPLGTRKFGPPLA